MKCHSKYLNKADGAKINCHVLISLTLSSRLYFHFSQYDYCCNLSVGVALNTRFTTNGMCAKNNTIYIAQYVVRTSNNRVIPMEWSWWVTSNNSYEASEQLLVLANGDDKSDLVGWTLLLLAAAVRSIACRPGFLVKCHSKMCECCWTIQRV